MNANASLRKRESWKRDLRLMLISSLLGVFVGFLNSFLNEDIFRWNVLTGALTGMATSLSISSVELHVFSWSLRRTRFAVSLLIRTDYYTLVVTFWLMMAYGFEKYLSTGVFRIVITRSFFVIALVILLFTFLLNVYVMLNRLLGHRILRYFLTGKYHRPLEEERVFLFLDLQGSTQIAEMLGDIRYQDFLNDFFYDITGSIIRTKGEIYKYVGDAVIVSWPIHLGLKNGNCLRCCQSIQLALSRVQERYQTKYGIIPSFRIGVHGGPVVAAEVGDYKREIAFLGDTVNTAARLQEECKIQGVECLISGDLLQSLRRHSNTYWFRWERIGDVKLRGKEHDTELIHVWFS